VIYAQAYYFTGFTSIVQVTNIVEDKHLIVVDKGYAMAAML